SGPGSVALRLRPGNRTNHAPGSICCIAPKSAGQERVLGGDLSGLGSEGEEGGLTPIIGLEIDPCLETLLDLHDFLVLHILDMSIDEAHVNSSVVSYKLPVDSGAAGMKRSISHGRRIFVNEQNLLYRIYHRRLLDSRQANFGIAAAAARIKLTVHTVSHPQCPADRSGAGTAENRIAVRIFLAVRK